MTTRLLIATAALALLAAGCSAATDGAGHSSAAAAKPVPTASAKTTPTPKPSAKAGPKPSAKPKHHVAATAVHVSLFEGDGLTYGIGMPVIARFTHRVTDQSAFERAAKVLLDGKPARGAWAWESSDAPGFAEEAHYRLATFWPAHSHISVSLPMKGLSAGKGLAYDDDLTLAMTIGAAHVSTVNYSDTKPSMTITSDGHVVNTFPVSLGDAENKTYRGTKIVEEFDREQDMGGPSPVPWSVRITTSGEFVHAAPWNNEIGRANLSHGCTNLSTADAEWFFHFSQLGDVVQYPNAPGELMTPTDGIGDWNVPWGQWRTSPYLG